MRAEVPTDRVQSAVVSHCDNLARAALAEQRDSLHAPVTPKRNLIRRTMHRHSSFYACQTPNPLSRSAIPNSTSISRAASYGIGL